MIIDSGVSSTRKRDTNDQAKVQLWFRAPKIWNEFLREKAAREYCSKSDLLRYAFRLAYGPELKELRVNPGARAGANHGHSSSNKEGSPTETGFPQGNALALAPYEIKEDPWIESMAAFVANKPSPQTHRVYRLVLSQFFTFVAKHPRDVKQSDLIRLRHTWTCFKWIATFPNT